MNDKPTTRKPAKSCKHRALLLTMDTNKRRCNVCLTVFKLVPDKILCKHYVLTPQELASYDPCESLFQIELCARCGYWRVGSDPK